MEQFLLAKSYLRSRSPCLETRVIARARIHLRAKFPTRAKNRPCQHNSRSCNRTSQRGTLLSQIVTLVTVTFCFHNSALSCFILKEPSDMFQQQGTLHYGYTNLGSHVSFQTIKSKQGCTCELMLLRQFLPGMD